MCKFIQALERHVLALSIAFFIVVIPLSLRAQTNPLQSPIINASYEKSPAREVDLLKVPDLNSQVTDLTGTLSVEQIASLNLKLSAFEASKGSQIAILLVLTTQPEAIEQYSLRVVEKWKLGRRKIDDGVLLLVAKDDRRLRFEVGYGLEGAINDLTAKRIITEVITPYFAQNQYFEGIDAGIDRLMKVIDGEPLPAPKERVETTSGDDMDGIYLIAFMLSIFLGGIFKSIFGKTLGGAATAGVVGFLAFTITDMIGIAIIAAFIGFFASMLGGLTGRGGPIIFTSNGGFGGSGRGEGFGGGGFSGGGGGFGGGGASGGW